MNAKTVISEALKRKTDIKQVYWVACGGSLIDLYPAHFMLLRESASIESGWYTAKEFLLFPPKKLGIHSMVIACSHSGNTQETVDACVFAKEAGAEIITLTDCNDSKLDDKRFTSWVYPWGDNIPIAEVPSGITLLLAAELLKARENFDKYDALVDAIKKMDGVVQKARVKINDGMTKEFANMCQKHSFFYILGSGANFSQAYGLAICSMMEMQWQSCAYIHSGEYFHGPFEVTDKNVFYFLQMGSGACREMDRRALEFLKSHTDQLMALDTLEFGMDGIDPTVRDYCDSILLYAINVELRAERGRLFDHPTKTRRYMGIEKY
jgi:fructoselysine-6-P-deglycase FrlB-like protein